MSIKGFKVKGQVEKYDYQSLDNLPFFNEISNWGVKVVPYAPGALFVKDAGATISHLHQDVHVIADMPIAPTVRKVTPYVVFTFSQRLLKHSCTPL